MSRYINFLRHDVEVGCLKHKELMAAEGHDELIAETTRTDAEQYNYYLKGYAQVRRPLFTLNTRGLHLMFAKTYRATNTTTPLSLKLPGESARLWVSHGAAIGQAL
jgi:hypothetical protein